MPERYRHREKPPPETGMMRDSSSVKFIWSLLCGPGWGACGGLPPNFRPRAFSLAARSANLLSYLEGKEESGKDELSPQKKVDKNQGEKRKPGKQPGAIGKWRSQPLMAEETIPQNLRKLCKL